MTRPPNQTPDHADLFDDWLAPPVDELAPRRPPPEFDWRDLFDMSPPTWPFDELADRRRRRRDRGPRPRPPRGGQPMPLPKAS